MNQDNELLVPITESPLDAYRGSGKNATVVKKERKKPGRKKKVPKPITIEISDTPITLYFN